MKKFLSLLFLITINISLTFAQQLQQEKILLTTDRTNYVPGDYIWFSGFILSPEDNSLLGNEFILHVCIYSPNGDLIDHNLHPINKGTFKGCIELPKLARKGLYRISAYTNWMQNWGTPSLCQKVIWVNGEKNHLNFTSNYKWSDPVTQDTLLVEVAMDNAQHNDFSFLNVTSKLQKAKGKPIIQNELTSKSKFNIAIPVKANQLKDSLKLKLEVANGNASSTQELLIRTNQIKPDVQFLPESGNLLANNQQLVAFKAIAPNGFPIGIEGAVYDNNNSKVAELTTIHDGMGSFYMTPEAGVTYHADVKTANGESYSYQLPAVQTEGFLLHIDSDHSQYKITINGTDVKLPLSLKIHKDGQVLAEQNIDKFPVKDLAFDRSSFPAGITHFTLTTNDNKPLCERLVFKAPEKTINISFPIEQTTYNKRDSINLPIQISNLNSNQLALYNISVIDENFYHSYISNDAVSELLLTSELPGFIGNAVYYLQHTHEAQKAAELLMLTNGWSRFQYPSPSETETGQFERETNIYLKGQMRHILTNRPLKGNYAQGLFYGGGQSVRKTATSDQNGEFIFKFPDIDFDLKTNLQFGKQIGGEARQIKGTLESLKEVKEIDMVKANMVTSTKNKAPEMPLIQTSQLNLDKAPYSNLINYIPQKPRKDNYFTVGLDTIVLNEVEVSKKRILNARENMRELFGTPKKVVTDKQIIAVADEISWYTSTWDLLEYLFPELDIQSYLAKQDYNYVYGVRHVNHPDIPVLVVLNGRRIYAHENPYLASELPEMANQIEQFRTINPKLITSVELYETKDNFNRVMSDFETFILSYTYNEDNAYNDVILNNKPSLPPYILSITTTGGLGSWGNDDIKKMNVDVHGFEPLKSPYAPKYDIPEADSIIFDGRKTLYWNPLIVAKNDAVKSFQFYTGDRDGNKIIMVNGISSDGIPFTETKMITVKQDQSEHPNLNPDQKNKISDIAKFRNASARHITSNEVTIKCISKAKQNPLTQLLLKTENAQYLTTNNEGEVVVNRQIGKQVTISGIGIKNQTLQLDQIKTDSLLIEFTPQETVTQKADNNAQQLVRSAINVSAKQMPKKQIREAFFREKVYENNYLISLEEWDIKSQLFSYGLYRDEGEVQFIGGKTYRTFDYRETIKATPNKREINYPLSADPMYVRQPFLDPTYLKYYNYAITGATTLDGKACTEVLFDVKPELYMPGFRGQLIINKETHMIMAVTYAISPTNIEYLDESFYIHDNPGRFDVELQKSTFFIRYNTELNNFYPLITYQKIDFLINKMNQQSFVRESLFNKICHEQNFNNRSEEDAERKTYLVKDPMYDKSIFEHLNTIKLPSSDYNEMGYLHEVSRFK